MNSDHLMFAMATVALLVTMLMAIARALLGPSIYDRILAANSFGTATVLLIAVHGFLTDRPEFLDIGLVYALINFIGMLAVLRFHKELEHRRADPEGEEAGRS